MKSRCYSPTNIGFPNYGARGITVCKEWRDDFSTFYKWSQGKWRRGLSIDRINNDLGYSPDNCRWATRHQQANNQPKNVRVKAFGKTKTLGEWAGDKRCSVPYSTIYWRIKSGVDPERAITLKRLPRRFPVRDARLRWIEAFGERKTISQWSEDPRCVVRYTTLYMRLKAGTSPEVAIASKSPFPR